MKDDYYKYISLYILARADYYYINGYYTPACILYRNALSKAIRYKGNRIAILSAIRAIENRIKITTNKEIQQVGNTGNHYIVYLKYIMISILGILYAVRGKIYFTY